MIQSFIFEAWRWGFCYCYHLWSHVSWKRADQTLLTCTVNTKHSLRPPEAMSASPLTFFKGVTEASLQSALGSYLFIYFLFVCLFFEESRKSDTETLPKALAVSFQEFKERNRNTLKTPHHRNPHTPKEVTLDPRNIKSKIQLKYVKREVCSVTFIWPYSIKLNILHLQSNQILTLSNLITWKLHVTKHGSIICRRIPSKWCNCNNCSGSITSKLQT